MCHIELYEKEGKKYIHAHVQTNLGVEYTEGKKKGLFSFCFLL